MKEITGEWVLGNNIPMVNGYSIEVQTNHDQIRTVHRRPMVDFSSLWYSDCTDPIQNMYCCPSNIKAWRLKPFELL